MGKKKPIQREPTQAQGEHGKTVFFCEVPTPPISPTKKKFVPSSLP